jgi:hypothetical protein
METKTSSTTDSMNRSPRNCRRVAFLLIPSALAWFALVPQARALCQEGCDLSNGNTFLGDDALILNTTGLDNTAIGFDALFSNTTGQLQHSHRFSNAP